MVQLYHMAFSGKKATALLLIGDIVVFAFSLAVTLILRYQSGLSLTIIELHVIPFAALFLLWTLVFYMAGLYGKDVILFKSKLPGMILRTQMLNIILAALFFFFIPEFIIAPKTNLAIYLVISLLGIYIWRIALFPRLTKPSFREGAAVVASGPEVQELVNEVNKNPRYPFELRMTVSPEALSADLEAFTQELSRKNISIIIVDMGHSASKEILSKLYNVSFLKGQYRFMDFYRVYEEVFDRVPLSLLHYDWYLENVSLQTSTFYAVSKRAIDIIGGLLMGLVTLIILPVIYVAMRLEGPGPLFLRQERFGLSGKQMVAYKFRSMTFDNSASSEWVGEEKKNRITRVGAILRRTSLDEFPQFLNVLRGELSLIGPRNDIIGLGTRLAEAIAYYNIRYTVVPGITGWAQINQRYEPGNISPQSIEETKMRLAYDLYYIKYRSLALDIVITLKTFKRMIFRVSSL
ncbi:sugar transferase [Acetobacteraceae bacterium]|nr:sugar transferase [Candidatus Parcubacteria bacterium]